jgi:hypothetical protein
VGRKDPPPLVSQVLSCSRAVNPIDRFVLAVIASHVGNNDRAWPSYDLLAAETGYSVRTVKRSVMRLSGKGDDAALDPPELIVERHGGLIAGRRKQYQPNAYIVVVSGDSVGTTDGASSGVTPDTTRGTASGDRDDASGVSGGHPVVTAVAHELQEELQVEPQSLSDDVVHNALVLIADRRVERAKKAGIKVLSNRAYTNTVLADVTDELGDELAERASNNHGWTAVDLASMFEPIADPFTAEVTYL